MSYCCMGQAACPSASQFAIASLPALELRLKMAVSTLRQSRHDLSVLDGTTHSALGKGLAASRGDLQL